MMMTTMMMTQIVLVPALVTIRIASVVGDSLALGVDFCTVFVGFVDVR